MHSAVRLHDRWDPHFVCLQSTLGKGGLEDGAAFNCSGGLHIRRGCDTPVRKSLNERTTFCSFALHGCVGNMDGLSREGAPRPASRSVIISDFRGHAFALAPEPRSVQEGVAVSATQESPGLLRLNSEERKLLPAPERQTTARTVAGSEEAGTDLGKVTLETSGNWKQDLLTWTGKRRAMLTQESRRQEHGEAAARASRSTSS